MKKSIVLVSGGMDSIVLAKYLKEVKGELIQPLFFDYGQPFLEQEKAAICVTTGAEVIKIPRLKAEEGDFVPYRNLIFLSHALSYAKKNGYESIYFGFIDPEKESGRFFDTSQEFIELANGMSEGIEVKAPFIDYTKYDVFCMARYYGFDISSTWSCNFPTAEGKECGKCGNCLNRKEYFSNIICAWEDSGRKVTDSFVEAYRKYPVKEVRANINDSCNMKCSHCFYGDFSSPAILSKEDYLSCLYEFIELGVKQIHFSGKEPLLDSTIFYYTEALKNTGVKYDVVTNGLNVRKYIEEIVTAGFYRVCVSYDEGNVREFDSLDTIKLLSEREVPTEAFVTLSNKNYGSIVDTLNNAMPYVSGFCVHVVSPCFDEKDAMTPECLLIAYLTLRSFAELEEKPLTIKIPPSYIEELSKLDASFKEDVDDYLLYGGNAKFGYFNPVFEVFCNSSLFSVTLMPDGDIKGCALDVANGDVNLSTYSVEKAVEIVREKSLARLVIGYLCAMTNECEYCTGECRNSKRVCTKKL